MREKLVIPETQWPQVIQELCALNNIEEVTVLSTCNRIEMKPCCSLLTLCY